MSTSRICWWTANPESVSEVESVVGFAAAEKGYTSTGVRRGCGYFVSENVCKKYNNESTGRGGDYLTGKICYCTTDLCNSAPRNSAPQTSIGPTDHAITDEADRPMTVSFIGVVSLLGLTTARLLSE